MKHGPISSISLSLSLSLSPLSRGPISQAMEMRARFAAISPRCIASIVPHAGTIQSSPSFSLASVGHVDHPFGQNRMRRVLCSAVSAIGVFCFDYEPLREHVSDHLERTRPWKILTKTGNGVWSVSVVLERNVVWLQLRKACLTASIRYVCMNCHRKQVTSKSMRSRVYRQCTMF